MAKFCENCGAAMDDGDAVCGQCGTPVGSVNFRKSGLGKIPGFMLYYNKYVLRVTSESDASERGDERARSKKN